MHEICYNERLKLVVVNIHLTAYSSTK